MIEELRKLFAEMQSIMLAEGESNWIRGIKNVVNTLSKDNPACDEEKIRDAGNTYKSMNRGAGSFDDYYIQRSDFNEQLEANRRFDEIRGRVWELLKRGQ